MSTQPRKSRRKTETQPDLPPVVIGAPASSMAIVRPVQHQLTDATTPDQPRGIECPRCGCRHFYVNYTRPKYGGRIMRSKSCRNCGRRVITTEKVQGS